MAVKQPYNNKMELIATQKIDTSPFQKRKYFDEEKLKELAASIEREGLIEPIITRPKGKRYELIAGERRLRAVKKYTKLKEIQAKIIIVDDLKARRISAAENLQREGFSAIETIEAIVEIIDAELIEDKEYAAMDNTPEGRVKTLLGKLHSIAISKKRGSNVPKNGISLYNKFVKQVEEIFKKLPKPLEWISFYVNDLPLITDICEEIRKISVENQLNKSQTKAITDIKNTSEKAFQDIVNKAKSLSEPKKEKFKQSSNTENDVTNRKSDMNNDNLNQNVNNISSDAKIKGNELRENSSIQTSNFNIIEKISNIYDFLKTICYSAIQIIFFSFSILIIVQTYHILDQKRPIFKPFNVPKSIEDQGINGIEIIKMLIDEMNHIRKKSSSLASRGKNKAEVINVVSDFANKEITMGGVEFTLESLVDIVAHVLGFKQLYINGSITKDENNLCITVRITEKPSKNFQNNKNNLNNIINESALHILKIIEPLTLGIDYFVNNNITELKKLINYVIENNPTKQDKAAIFIMEGFIYSCQGNHKEALKRYILAEKIDTDNAVAYYMSADAFRWLNQPQKAVEKYITCLKINPKDIEVHTKWAEALIESQKIAQAENKYNEIIKLAPDNARVYINWGDALTFKLQNPENGIEKYKKASELEPGNSEIFAKWANALIQKNEFEQAIVMFKKAILLNPKNIGVYISWGNFLIYNLNKPRQGIEKFQIASELEPNASEIFSTWGMALLHLKQPEKAIDKFQKAIKIESNNIWVLIDWGHALIKLKRYEDAILKFEQILQINPSSEWAYALWGYALIKLTKYKEAIIKCQKALDNNLNFPFAYVFLGKALLELNQPEKAINNCKKAIELEPAIPIAFSVWGDALLKLKQPESAIDKYKKAVEIEPDEASYYYNWGQALVKLKRYNEAIEKYNQVTDIEPKGNFFQKAIKQINYLNNIITK